MGSCSSKIEQQDILYKYLKDDLVLQDAMLKLCNKYPNCQLKTCKDAFYIIHIFINEYYIPFYNLRKLAVNSSPWKLKNSEEQLDSFSGQIHLYSLQILLICTLDIHNDIVKNLNNDINKLQLTCNSDLVWTTNLNSDKLVDLKKN